jgi:hypothetical protein
MLEEVKAYSSAGTWATGIPCATASTTRRTTKARENPLYFCLWLESFIFVFG